MSEARAAQHIAPDLKVKRDVNFAHLSGAEIGEYKTSSHTGKGVTLEDGSGSNATARADGGALFS
jgi:hypothetical protein